MSDDLPLRKNVLKQNFLNFILKSEFESPFPYNTITDFYRIIITRLQMFINIDTWALI